MVALQFELTYVADTFALAAMAELKAGTVAASLHMFWLPTKAATPPAAILLGF